MTPRSARGPVSILHLASTSDMGGAERMILFLVDGMDRSRFTPHVGALVGSGELLRRAQGAGAQVHHFQSSGKLDPRAILRIAVYVRRNRIRLVQTHGLRADFAGRIGARLGGAQVVSTIHSIDPWRGKLHSILDRRTAPLVRQFIAVCEAAKNSVVKRERLSPERIEVIPIGLPPRRVPREDKLNIRSVFAVPEDAFPVIGVLANLREMKGHLDMLQAIPGIRARFPKVLFLFAGRDDSNGRLEQMAKEMGVIDSIRFLGYVTDTTALLAIMDIFMLPSHWEGLPVSIIEAMHAGLPIITTKVGGIPELVNHEKEALLIEPSQPAQISDAVVRMAEDTELRETLGAAACARANELFSLERMIRSYQFSYSRILNLS